MLDQTLLKELTEKLFSNLPDDLKSNLGLFKSDLSKTFKVALEQTLTNLDLVSRQQFDVQTKVLAKACDQLEVLDAKISELEAKLDKQK